MKAFFTTALLDGGTTAQDLFIRVLFTTALRNKSMFYYLLDGGTIGQIYKGTFYYGPA